MNKELIFHVCFLALVFVVVWAAMYMAVSLAVDVVVDRIEEVCNAAPEA